MGEVRFSRTRAGQPDIVGPRKSVRVYCGGSPGRTDRRHLGLHHLPLNSAAYPQGVTTPSKEVQPSISRILLFVTKNKITAELLWDLPRGRNYGGIRRYPKTAGTASPTGSGDLKHPSFPPVAKGLPSRDLGGCTAVATQRDFSTHIQ